MENKKLSKEKIKFDLLMESKDKVKELFFYRLVTDNSLLSRYSGVEKQGFKNKMQSFMRWYFGSAIKYAGRKRADRARDDGEKLQY